MELKVIEFTNANGNVSVKARDKVRNQIYDKVLEVLRDAGVFADVVTTATKGIAIPLGINGATNDTIYAHLDLSVSTKSPDYKPAKSKGKAKAKQVPEVEVPDLF